MQPATTATSGAQLRPNDEVSPLSARLGKSRVPSSLRCYFMRALMTLEWCTLGLGMQLCWTRRKCAADDVRGSTAA